jgi:hypothetical protein
MKEYNVDCQKYRKSTHIAGVDVDSIVTEKGQCILTIKDAYYSKNEIVNGKTIGEDVNGKFLEGYIVHFVEDVKPFVVNSGNRKNISYIVKELKKCTAAESRLLTNWIGVQIELYFNPSVKFGKEVTGGICVKPNVIIKQKQPINQERFTKALDAIKSGKFDKEQLIKDYVLTEEQIEQL